MTYKFFFVNKDDATDPTKLGYAWAKLHEGDWVNGPSGLDGNITTGVSKGIDNVIHDGKAYQINRLFFDIDSKFIIVICTESVLGCDTKTNF